MSYNNFQSIFKKIALLSRELDQLGLYSHSNKIDSFLRKLAGPQQPQSVEFDPMSISGEILPPYKGSGYVALPSLVGDRPVYIVSGGDLNKVLREKGFKVEDGDDEFLHSLELAKKQIPEIKDPAISAKIKEHVKLMKNRTIWQGGASTVLVPVGEGLRLVPGISMGKDSQGRDIPLLVNSSGGYRPGGPADKEKRKSTFISSVEERNKSYVEGKGEFQSPEWYGYYKKPSMYTKFNVKKQPKNVIGVFGATGSDSFAYSYEISRSAIKDPFVGISNPGKEALEMRTQANLKVSPTDLSFGSTPPGKPIVTSITLYSVGFVPVKIESIESDNPEVFTVSQPEISTLGPGERTKLTVTFSTSLPYGDKNGIITIKSNSKDGDLVVPITASVERPALPPRETGMVNFRYGLRKSTRLKIPIISNDDYLILERSNPELARQVNSFDSLTEERQEDLLEAIARKFERDAPDTDTLDEKFRKARGIYD